MGHGIRVVFLDGAISSLLCSSPAKKGLVGRVMKLATAVHEGVKLTFHFWYGDLGHERSIEPRNVALMLDIANVISRRVERRVERLHMAVPKSRVDALEESLTLVGHHILVKVVEIYVSGSPLMNVWRCLN